VLLPLSPTYSTNTRTHSSTHTNILAIHCYRGTNGREQLGHGSNAVDTLIAARFWKARALSWMVEQPQPERHHHEDRTRGGIGILPTALHPPTPDTSSLLAKRRRFPAAPTTTTTTTTVISRGGRPPCCAARSCAPSTTRTPPAPFGAGRQAHPSECSSTSTTAAAAGFERRCVLCTYGPFRTSRSPARQHVAVTVRSIR
jgi:hypothetical protein